MNSTSGNHAVQGIGVTPRGSHRGKEKDLSPYRGDLEAGSEACQTFPRWGKASTEQLLWSVTSTELYHVCI